MFVHDRQTGQTTRVSVASDGTQGNNDSVLPVLSADGRFVAFYVDCLEPGGGRHQRRREDVFVHDRQTGQTTRVSVASDGVAGELATAGGRRSAPTGGSSRSSRKPSNLVAGDTNGTGRRLRARSPDRADDARERRRATGAQGNNDSDVADLSADGRYVAFHSVASNLVAGDTNGAEDVFVHDRQTGQTTRVSVAERRRTGQRRAARHANVSADGRFVAFQSSASNLVPGDTNGVDDVFVHDRQTGQTRPGQRGERRQPGERGEPGGNDFGSGPVISADGRSIAFPSSASNLVASDTNTTYDIFVVGGVSVSPTTLSVPGAGAHAERQRLVRLPGHVVDGHDDDAVDHDRAAGRRIGERDGELHGRAEHRRRPDRDARRGAPDRHRHSGGAERTRRAERARSRRPRTRPSRAR